MKKHPALFVFALIWCTFWLVAGCGQSMISVITQTPPANAPQNFNDYNFVTYAEAARSQWAMKGTSNEVLAMGGALSLAGLSTALLATAAQSPIARGIAVGANGLLGILGVLKPGDRDAAYNTGAALLLKAESDYILAVRAKGFCTVPVDQMTTAGAQLFAQTNAAIVIVNDLIQGIMEAGFLQAMQQFYGAQLTPQPAKAALKDAAPCH